MTVSERLAVPGPGRDCDELLQLLATKRLRVVAWDDVATLQTRYRHRRTFRLQLESGELVKGRVVRRSLFARRMKQLIPRLPSEQAAAVLAVRGRAVLEQWVDGPSLQQLPWDKALMFSAGTLMGSVHQAMPVRILRAESAEIGRLLKEFCKAVSSLRRREALSANKAEQLLRLVTQHAPAVSQWSLVHRDFCAENLVAGASGLCLIDNVTIRTGFVEEDLARWCYRWPMSEAQRIQFLAGYAQHANPAPFLRFRPFWMVVAAVLAAGFRARSGVADFSAALEELDRWTPALTSRAA